MLAFTTYFEPRNLLMERAFLGLSTMTRERPAPPFGVPADCRFEAADLVAVEADARLRPGDADLADFGAVSDALAVLRATVFS